MIKNNGGLAFPGGRVTSTENADEGCPMNEGMSLLDYFAGQALVGIIGHTEGPAGEWHKCASDAYLAARAMLGEQKKQ